MHVSIPRKGVLLLCCGVFLSATPTAGACEDGVDHVRATGPAGPNVAAWVDPEAFHPPPRRFAPSGGDPKRVANPFDEDVIVFTANQGFVSRIYVLRMDGSVLDFHEFENYRFVDLEVVNNEVYAAEAFAPRVLKVDLETWDLDVIVDDWSLFYFYDVAFDGTYFYVTEWDLNRYEFDGTKDGVASSDEDTGGGAWDGTYYWTLNYEQNIVKCWDLSGWPNVVEVPSNNFAPPTAACRGLWFDGQFFWTAESIEDTLGYIYRFDYGGTVISQRLAPAFQGWGACVIKADPVVPTVSAWGVIVMALVLIGAATILFRPRRLACTTDPPSIGHKGPTVLKGGPDMVENESEFWGKIESILAEHERYILTQDERNTITDTEKKAYEGNVDELRELLTIWEAKLKEHGFSTELSIEKSLASFKYRKLGYYGPGGFVSMFHMRGGLLVAAPCVPRTGGKCSMDNDMDKNVELGTGFSKDRFLAFLKTNLIEFLVPENMVLAKDEYEQLRTVSRDKPNT